MTQLNTLLEIRNKIKESKPDFIRQDNPKRRKLNYKWRKPKGIHSKIRHHFKGRRKMPSPGYKSPRKIKGFHSSGLKTINLSSLDEFKKINKENEGIVISKNIGTKKRLEILKKAKELNVNVLNLNADEQIKKIEGIINSKKKVAKETKKEATKKEIKEKETKVKESKENTTEKKSEEDRKEFEKKEKDKILTKKM